MILLLELGGDLECEYGCWDMEEMSWDRQLAGRM